MGYQGHQGAIGYQGHQGTDGAYAGIGHQGYTGYTGFQGFQGLPGEYAGIGLQGLQGPTGYGFINETTDVSVNRLIVINDISAGDVSFNNIYLTGTTFFAGDVSGNDASFNNIGVNTIYGREVYVPSEFNNSWTIMGQRIDGDSDYHNLGESMSLNSLGDVVVFGIPSASGGYSSGGEVKVYRWDGSSWNQVANTINGSRS